MKKIFFLFLFCFVTGSGFGEETSKEEFRITDFDGQVAVIPQGSKKASPALKNLSLKAGDQVVTGRKGRVEIGTKTGTVIELKEKSSIKVETLSDQIQVFFLKAGRFLAHFKTHRERTRASYKVKTPVAVASVRERISPWMWMKRMDFKRV